MTSIGTGYDLSPTTFSPEGRVFQVEYAMKAADNGGTVVGIKAKDGIVLGVERLISSKMLVTQSNRLIQTVDLHCGVASAGLAADARQICSRARSEASSYLNEYGQRIPVTFLSDRLSHYVQAHTLYGSYRPFGLCAVIGGHDSKGYHLHMIEPSGESYGYVACAVGKGKITAKTELEKLKFSELTAREAVIVIAKIIYSVHDDIKDKEFELEISWCTDETGFKHQTIPQDLYARAVAEGKAAAEKDERD